MLLVEELPGLQAVVELADHPVEQMPLGLSVPVSSLASAITVDRLAEDQAVLVVDETGDRSEHALIDRALYLTKDWAADEERRELVGVGGLLRLAGVARGRMGDSQEGKAQQHR